MPIYDNPGAPSQLGGDLNEFSSDGWPFGDDQTYWDGYATNDVTPDIGSGFGITYSNRLVDGVIHQGDLYVAWVEPDSTSGGRMMRGPFVKKWTGSTWSALGGEVDPSITPFPIRVPTSTSDTTSNDDFTGPNPFVDPIGTRGNPANPRLVSDGTDLYCVYSVREVEVANNAPPTNSYVTGAACGCYVNTCDHRELSNWAPRKTYVRKWSGSSWDLYGDLPASTNNGYPNALSQPGSYYFMEAWASPGEVGNVYVGVTEWGPNASIRSWLAPTPFCFLGLQLGPAEYAQLWLGATVALFNSGTGTPGTVKTLGTYTCPATTSTSRTCTQTGYDTPVNPCYPVNNSGHPYVFLYTELSGGRGVGVAMVDWATLTTTRDIAQGDFGGDATLGAVSHDPSTDKYYFGGAAIYEVPDDASGPIVPLDYAAYGTSVFFPFGSTYGTTFSDRLATDMGNGDIWAINVGGGDPGVNGQYDLDWYHHDCPGWSAGDFVSGDDTAWVPVGEPIPVLYPTNSTDTVVAMVGAFRNPASELTDLKIKVFEAPICRGCSSCTPGVSADPYIKARWSTQLAS